MGHKKTKKIVYLALLSALAIILHTVDHYLSSPLPLGVKLGIANIVALLVVDIYGTKEMFVVNFFRVIISGLLTGTLMHYTFLMSCGGVFLSSVVLALFKRYTKLPLVSVSIIAAICHNIGQMFVISFVISSAALMPYIFVMLAASIPTGILTGLTAIEVLKRVKREQFQ